MKTHEMANGRMTRRSFVGAFGATGAAALAGIGLADCMAPSALAKGAASSLSDGAGSSTDPFAAPATGTPVEASVDPQTGEVTVNDKMVVRYSACLGCYSSCGNRVKLDRDTGEVLGVGGNPYNPNCAYPYLDFDDPLTSAYLAMSSMAGQGNTHRGTVCGRGQATWDAYNQADRITMPLKRAGKRGENKWQAISWEQLISEVTEGGKLFADLGEDTQIAGLKELHDTQTPLNPDSPGLGSVSNQVVEFGERGAGRTVILNRFMSSYGSINAYRHTST